MSGTINCPENYIPVRYPYTNSLKIEIEKWTIPLPEMQEKFTTPIQKKAGITRNGLLEQFYWTELSNEYIRQQNKLLEPMNEKFNTEYMEKYGHRWKCMPINANQILIDKYPLNDTEAITFWCADGKKPTRFKMSRPLTKPNTENYDIQFC